MCCAPFGSLFIRTWFTATIHTDCHRRARRRARNNRRLFNEMENSVKKFIAVVAVFVVAASNVWGQPAKPPLDVARDKQAASGAAEPIAGGKPISAAEKAANEF